MSGERSERVELRLPATVEWLALARITGAAVASRLDFSYDEISDLRLAIDELCLTLVEGRPASYLEICFEADGAALTVHGTAIAAGPGERTGADGALDANLALSSDLSTRILDALVDAHGSEDGSDTRRAWLRKQRSHQTSA
jgi:hypothetical protein